MSETKTRAERAADIKQRNDERVAKLKAEKERKRREKEEARAAKAAKPQLTPEQIAAEAAEKEARKADADAKAAEKARVAAEKAAAKALKDAEREAAEAEKKATVKTAERELSAIAKEVNHRLDAAARQEKVADDHRLAAALQLAEAEKRCKELGLAFKAWSEEHVNGQSYETVRKLLAVGKSEDPPKALADMRLANARRNAELRERQRREREEAEQAQKDTAGFSVGGEPEKGSESLPPNKGEWVDPDDAPELTSEDFARGTFVEPAAVSLGETIGAKAAEENVITLAVTVADEVMGYADEFTKHGAVNAATFAIEGLAPEERWDVAKFTFEKLIAAHKVAFVEWAADHIGATVAMPDFGAPTAEDVLDYVTSPTPTLEGVEFVKSPSGELRYERGRAEENVSPAEVPEPDAHPDAPAEVPEPDAHPDAPAEKPKRSRKKAAE